ncbi:glycerophosphoryl diester phosphodiesterase [Paenibacillus algicola]|uniref:Glycerophosphoryl diester phosphodiesterase n=1 Tax=Paenibacillus algicola TaxID=2565926 RepID=A0A4P8XNL5_9BACL|nr:glycerophosphodiester phosphodiesterase [Paenibacillus algicola]QCT04023.1 glycerophosphoryl diester phosphodiesterase [Paenibacillus algicola]
MSIPNKPLIFAHRGASGEAPENTLAAFRLGLEQGCTGIELDIHLSKDNSLVVIHDDSIDRTTNGSGKVNDMTVEQLQTYDAGSWFHERYAGETIPTLAQVLHLVPPQVMLNVEIKGKYHGAIEPALVKLLRDCDRLDQVVISSFDWKSLRLIRELEPRIEVGLLYSLTLDRHEELPLAAGTKVFSLHPNYSRLELKDLKGPQSKGLKVYGWTINEEASLVEAAASGIDGIITDYPGRLKALLDQASW